MVGVGCGEVGRYGMCGGPGRVDDVHGVVEGVQGGFDEGFEERVVGAAQQESVGVGGFGQGFEKVDAEDFGGDGVVDPTFFYQGDEEGAGFLGCGQAEGGQGVEVGVGLDGRRGGQDENVGRGVFECGGLGSGLDYAEDRDGSGGGFDLGESEGGGGVAGDDEDVGTLIEEEAGAGDGVAGDGLAGF